MDYADLYLALTTIVEAALPTFSPAISSFDFEDQPNQESDRVYRLTLARESTQGYMGGGFQAEIYRAEVWLSRRINRNATETEASLRSDLQAVEDGLLAEVTADYNVVDDSTTIELSSSGPDNEYIVGRLSVVLDVERTI